MPGTLVDLELLADRRRFLRAATVGASLGAIVFFLVLLDGQWTLLRHGLTTNFYDAQAHSLLHLRWDVPSHVAGLEGIRLGSKTYLYFGPWPAVLRLPVALFTSSLDGELTQVSMLAAYAVTMLFVVRLAWRLRALVRSGEPVTKGECWALGITIFTIGGGSVLVFLAGHLSVYHEAELWGAALALAALDFVIAWAITPSNRSLILASLFATLAFLTRASVGGGPVVAIGLLLLAVTTTPTRRLAGLSDDTDLRRYGLKLGVALAVPVLLYAYVNEAKFGSLFSIPLDHQVLALGSRWQQAVLRSNGGSLFSLKYVPTMTLQYFRPDAIRFDSLLPWVSFPGRARNLGHVFISGVEPTSSIPASMPALTVLGIIGVISLIRPPRVSGPGLAVVRGPLLGAVAGAFVALTIAYVAQRYLSDFLPALILAGLVGIHVLLRWIGTNRGRASAAVAVLSLLAIASLWFNVGFAILYGHEVGLGIPRDNLVNFLDLQYRVHDVFPGGAQPHVQRGPERPFHPRPRNTVFVVGDCKAAYWSTGRLWVRLSVEGKHPAFCERR